MTAFRILCAVLFAGFAVSYGWGMRGTVIGGEKGALVPGALLGFSVAWFTGNGELKPYAVFFIAVGALTMFYGGTEPYAQTMSYIMARDRQGTFYEGKQKKGAVGIFLKGGLWFGICAGMLALLLLALSGEMDKWECIFLPLLIPVLSLVGTCVWNKPYDKEKDIYPKIYFSNGSREEWGGNVALLLFILFFAAKHKSLFAIGAALAGFLVGGLGFLFGLLLYDYTVRKHNGRYLFGSLQTKGYIDGWKIMEHFFGAFAGGGVMLYFCLNSHYVIETANAFAVAGVIHSGDKADRITAVAVPVLLLLTALQYPMGQWYEKKHGHEPKNNVYELSERPCYSAIPLCFLFTGGEKTAWAVALLTLSYALCEKCGLEWFQKYKSRNLIKILYAVVFFGTVTYFFLTLHHPSLFAVLFLCTFGYTLSVWLYALMPDRFREKKEQGKKFGEYFKSGITVYTHFMLQSIILMCTIFINP